MILSLFCRFLVAFKISETFCCRFLVVFPLALLRIIFGMAAGCAVREPLRRKFCTQNLSLFIFTFAKATSHPEWQRLRLLSAWLVDSAIRWRRNGVGGLKKIVVRLRLFDCWFFGGFAICRIARIVAESGFDRGAAVVFVPKPAGRVLRASAGWGFGSHG